MDLAALLSFPRPDGTGDQNTELPWKHFLLIVFICIFGVTTFGSIAFFSGCALFGNPGLGLGNIKFSMEPVAYTGLDTASSSSPPAFNVTLHAKSTFMNDLCCCSGGGGATVQAVYGGLTIAKGEAAPFCVKAKGGGIVSAAVSSGWLALPAELRERIERDRRGGGVELEVDLSFHYNQFPQDPQGDHRYWVRCRAMLDAGETSPCKTFILNY